MPKVAYSNEEKEKVKEALIITGLKLMSEQGIQQTRIEQVYRQVGISRSFFYSFFSGEGGADLRSHLLSAAKIDCSCSSFGE